MTRWGNQAGLRYKLTGRNESKPGAVYLRLPIAAHLRGLIVFVCVVPYSLGSYFRSSLAHLSCSHAYFDSYSGSSLVSLFAGLLLRLVRVTPSPARPLPVQTRNKKEK